MNTTYNPDYIPSELPTVYPDGCPNSSDHTIDTSIRYNDCNRTQMCTTCGIVDAALKYINNKDK
jgi:hypothetical protein